MLALSRSLYNNRPFGQLCLLIRSAVPPTRKLSSSTSESEPHQNQREVDVKFGTDKHISLTIYSPPKLEPNAPIVLYFNSGLPTSIPPSVTQLALGANATVVDVKHKVSREASYPLPVHSVLAGYDWVRKNLRQEASTSDPTAQTRQMGVCGEVVGGGLATVLALTECHGTSGIRAAAVNNAIVDWTALDELHKDETSKLHGDVAYGHDADLSTDASYALSLENLRDLRRQIFVPPEKLFDPFASPLLFFRTPRFAMEVKSSESPENELKDDQETDGEDSPNLVKKRLSHRSFPPLHSDLILPRIRLEVGSESPLKDQGYELIQLMERSLDKRRGSKPHDGMQRFEAVTRKGLGMWDDADMFRIGQWLGETLRETQT